MTSPTCRCEYRCQVVGWCCSCRAGVVLRNSDGGWAYPGTGPADAAAPADAGTCAARDSATASTGERGLIVIVYCPDIVGLSATATAAATTASADSACTATVCPTTACRVH